jgi:hypothetical protein
MATPTDHSRRLHREAKARRKKQNPERVKMLRREAARRWRARNPERHRLAIKKWREANRQRHRDNAYWWSAKKEFGITKDQWDEMLRSQGGVCAICSVRPEEVNKRFHVDHDHATGKNRGLLCHYCNLMLGQAKDSATRLRLGAAYLEAHRG